MLVFQPELADVLPDHREKNEVIICLDCSSSMEGVAFTQAKQIALYALSLLGEEQKVNIMQFGTGECAVPSPSWISSLTQVYTVQTGDHWGGPHPCRWRRLSMKWKHRTLKSAPRGEDLPLPFPSSVVVPGGRSA